MAKTLKSEDKEKKSAVKKSKAKEPPVLSPVQPEPVVAVSGVTPEPVPAVTEPVEVKPAPKTFSTFITVPSPRPEVDLWRYPEDVVANQWYVGIYFSDKTPYLVRWDNHLWRDNRGLPVAVPMRIKPVGEFPKPPKTPKKDVE